MFTFAIDSLARQGTTDEKRMTDQRHTPYDAASMETPRASEPVAAYQPATNGVRYGAPYAGKALEADEDRAVRNRMTYFVYCINAFAEHYHLSPKQAFAYLHRFKGLEFLDECYEAEHQLSIRDAVNDLSIICKRNGGALV